jgi:hypothetical protein
VLAGERIKGKAGKADYSVDVGNCMFLGQMRSVLVCKVEKSEKDEAFFLSD